MQVWCAYILVVVVFSTTPLAIQMSNSSLSYVDAISFRVFLALIICFIWLKGSGAKLIEERRDIYLYAASAMGLFPNMLLVYWAAQYIPSGLMSVIMGVYPLFVGVFSIFVLQENPFNKIKLLAMVITVGGVWVIHKEQMLVGEEAIKGVWMMIFVCATWAVSTVWVKKLGVNVSPLRQGTGALVFSTPFFAVAWLVGGGGLSIEFNVESTIGLLYLVIMGSVVGHTLWYFVLQKCTAISVSLVALMTPILAIAWGVLFAGERFSFGTVCGTGLVIAGLLLYQGVIPSLFLVIRQFFKKNGGARRKGLPVQQYD